MVILVMDFFVGSRCLYICDITKTRLFKYIENFKTKKENFQIKKSDIFHISAQNIDCRYSLEPPRFSAQTGFVWINERRLRLRLIPSSVDAPGKLCVVIVAFSVYLFCSFVVVFFVCVNEAGTKWRDNH